MKRSRVGYQDKESHVIVVMPKTHIGDDTLGETADETTMLKTLSPLITSMKFFGLFFLNDNENIASNNSNRSRWSLPKFSSKSHVYAFAVLIAMWLNILRLATMFSLNDKPSYELIWKLIILVYTLMTVIVQTAFYRACSTGRMSTLLQGIHKKFSMNCYNCVRMNAIVYATVAWIFVAINIAFGAYVHYSSEENAMDVTLAPIRTLVFPKKTIIPILRAVYLVMHLYVNGAAHFPMAFSLFISKMLSHLFAICNRKFRESIENSDSNKESFEDLRRHHQVLSRLVSKADKFMCLSNAAYVGGLIFLVIATLYSLLFNPLFSNSPIFLLAAVFWFSWSMCGLLVVSFSGVVLNHAVSFHLLAIFHFGD